MDPQLLRHYERELQHLREMGGEFAREFPKIAGRLGLENYACADPYVERLLEGFSFLAARVQMKIEAEFPRFTEQMLEIVYPHHLAPTPSMAVVQFQPDLDEGSLAAGYTLPRGTALRSLAGKSEETTCEYRTGQATTLWPLELTQASYSAYRGEIAGVDPARIGPVKATLRLRLRATAGLSIAALALDTLRVHLRGNDALPARLYEQLMANAVGLVVLPVQPLPAWHEIIGKERIRPVGFEPDQALLPYGARSFDGYRLLHEYFAFPQRFMFADLGGLGPAVRRCTGREIDVVVLFDRLQASLEQGLTGEHLALHCAPVINLFPKRADRIGLTDGQPEYHLVPDRTRPQDYEVYRVVDVTGYGSGAPAQQRFRPFYSASDLDGPGAGGAYFQVRRERRALSQAQRQRGPRSTYLGTECYVALVDPQAAPFRGDLRQLGVETLCTNRDLPLTMPLGTGRTDFTLEAAAPVKAVRCVAGPSAPAASRADGALAWRLVSHLTLNHLAVSDAGASPESLREMLRLYVAPEDPIGTRQIEGVAAVASRPIVRRIPGPGPIAHGRGVEVTVTIDEAAFEGAGAVAFGAVLERFFAKLVSINSFTETVIRSTTRGEVARFATRSGQCATL